MTSLRSCRATRARSVTATKGYFARRSAARNAFLVRDLFRHGNLAMTGLYVNRAADPVRTLSD